MTQEKLIDAITELDSDILERYFTVKADLAKKKEPQNNAWVKWASLAACFCLAVMATVIGRQSSNISTVAVINYGPFIFIPMLIVSFIPLFVSFVKKKTTLKSSLVTSAISLVAVNILNVLVVCIHSHFGGINILGNLPIILISLNTGSVVSIIAFSLIDRKIKSLRLKLPLWFLVIVVSAIVAGMAHNILISCLGRNYLFIA